MEETFRPEIATTSSDSSNDGDVEDDDLIPLTLEQRSAPDFRYSSNFTPVDLSSLDLKSESSHIRHSGVEFKQVC